MSGFFTAAATLRKRSSWLVLACCLVSGPAPARTWEVGPARQLTTPAEAARVAQDGDRVVFDPGVYRECAVWPASRLTIEARQPPATMNRTVMTQTIMTGPTCASRGLFVFLGNDIAVRGLIFLGARGLWHNSAGILMEGANLTVENSQFVDNENGILAGGPPSSVVRIRHDLFQGNGTCEGACAHALYIGNEIARLEVIGCVFLDTAMARSSTTSCKKAHIAKTRRPRSRLGSPTTTIQRANS
jgi:hypothetical protein